MFDQHNRRPLSKSKAGGSRSFLLLTGGDLLYVRGKGLEAGSPTLLVFAMFDWTTNEHHAAKAFITSFGASLQITKRVEFGARHAHKI